MSNMDSFNQVLVISTTVTETLFDCNLWCHLLDLAHCCGTGEEKLFLSHANRPTLQP